MCESDAFILQLVQITACDFSFTADFSLQRGVVICTMTRNRSEIQSFSHISYFFYLSGAFLFFSLLTKLTMEHYFSKLLPVKEPRDLLPSSVLQFSFREISFSRLCEIPGSNFFSLLFVKKLTNRATKHLLSPYPVTRLCLLMQSIIWGSARRCPVCIYLLLA